jgi:2,4-dienoyl-CoA reductase-like NADH-dependent reductase (Old Yellow Enzyme family)
MGTYSLVQRPLTINGCAIRNRIFRSAHGSMLAFLTEGVVGEPLIAYHLARARGGVGLIILDAGAVHPSSNGGLLAFKKENAAGWREIGERCRAEGTKVFQQIYHAGSTVGPDPYTGAAAWSPSGGPSPGHPAPSMAMSKFMIDEVIACHVDSAVRCKEAGLDGVELHAAHGYLLHEFFSPLTNRRTDEYGGSLENRMRLIVEILRALRASLGADYPLGIRLSGSEWKEGGLTSEEIIALAQRLESLKLIDFLDMSSGSYFASHKIFAAMHERAGYELPTSTAVTRAVKIPTLVNGRFTTLAECEDVLATGVVEMVSMVRALVADPALVKKSLEGREAEVRPCIGCNQECIGGVLGPRMRIGCVGNVDAGNEWMAKPLQKAARSRRVLVVGAGPSGMEAARTAALRGHTVAVHEAEGETGGNMRYARRAPFRADIGKLVDFQANELRRLGVELRLNSKADLETVRKYDADCVIIAAGAAPRRDGRQRNHPFAVPGIDLPHVRSMQEVLASPPPPGTRAVVLDDLGTYPPISVAEHLLAAGGEVMLASSLAGFGMGLIAAVVQRPTAERIGAYEGFSFLAFQTVAAITPTHVTLREIGNQRERKIEANLVVLCTAGEPRRDLYDALVSARKEAHLVGDAVASTDLGTAVRSGHMAGLTV